MNAATMDTLTRALNMSQITVHRPPPFPAKVTSSRYRGYVDEHGTADAWELDALDPPVLAGLITSSVMRHWDPDIHGHNCEIVAARREQLRRDMRSNPETLMERL